MSSQVDAALSRRNARRFLLAVLVSGFGSTAMMLVAGVWAKELTGSDAAAGWMSVAMWGPVVAAPWLGGIADRVGHRRVLVGGNLLIGLALVSLTLVEHGGGLPLLAAVLGLYGLSFVVLDVAEGAVLPSMVSDTVLADINGRRMALQEGAKIVATAGRCGAVRRHRRRWRRDPGRRDVPRRRSRRRGRRHDPQSPPR